MAGIWAKCIVETIKNIFSGKIDSTQWSVLYRKTLNFKGNFVSPQHRISLDGSRTKSYDKQCFLHRKCIDLCDLITQWSVLYSNPLHDKTNSRSFQLGISSWMDPSALYTLPIQSMISAICLPNQCVYLRSSFVRSGLIRSKD